MTENEQNDGEGGGRHGMYLSWLFLGHGAASTQNYTSSVASHRRKPIQGQLLACLDYGWALTVTVECNSQGYYKMDNSRERRDMNSASHFI